MKTLLTSSWLALALLPLTFSSSRAATVYLHRELFQQPLLGSPPTRYLASGFAQSVLNHHGEVYYVTGTAELGRPGLWLPRPNYGLPAGFNDLTSLVAGNRTELLLTDDGWFFSVVVLPHGPSGSPDDYYVVQQGSASSESRLVSVLSYKPLPSRGDVPRRQRWSVRGVTAEGHPFGLVEVQAKIHDFEPDVDYNWNVTQDPADYGDAGMFFGGQVTLIPGMENRTACGSDRYYRRTTRLGLASPNGNLLTYATDACGEPGLEASVSTLAVVKAGTVRMVAVARSGAPPPEVDPNSGMQVNDAGTVAGSDAQGLWLWRQDGSVTRPGITNVATFLLDSEDALWFFRDGDFWRWSAAGIEPLNLPWTDWGYIANPTPMCVNDRGQLLVTVNKPSGTFSGVGVLLSPTHHVKLTVSTNRVLAGTSLTLTATVTSPASLPLTDVAPTGLPVWNGTGEFLLQAGPVPTPPLSLAAGAEATFQWTLRGTKSGEGRFTVAVQALNSGQTTVSLAAPSERVRILGKGDLLIKSAAETDFAGDNLYSRAVQSEQTKKNGVGLEGVSEFQVRVENDDSQPQAFRLGTAEDGTEQGWEVNYLFGGQDVSTSLRSPAGLQFPELGPNSAFVVTVRMTPTVAAPATDKNVTLALSRADNPLETLDVVKAVSHLIGDVSVTVNATKVITGTRLEAVVTVHNSSQHRVTNLRPGLLEMVPDQVYRGGLEVVTGPVPLAAAGLEPGQDAQFRYVLRGTQDGLVKVRASVHGVAFTGGAYDPTPGLSEEIEVATVRVLKIEPVQSVYDTPLVADKRTVLRLTVENEFRAPLSTELEASLGLTRGPRALYREAAIFPHGQSTFLWPKEETFTVPATGPLKVEVNPDDPEWFDGKFLEIPVTVKIARPLKIAYVRLRFDNVCGVTLPPAGRALEPTVFEVAHYAEKTSAYLASILPLPDVRGTVAPGVVVMGFRPLVRWCNVQMSAVERELASMASSLGVDVVVGILPQLRTDLGPGLAGIRNFYELSGENGVAAETYNGTFGTGAGIVVNMIADYTDHNTSKPKFQFPAVLAHEVGHVYGLALPQYRSEIGGKEEYIPGRLPWRRASEGVWLDRWRIYLPTGRKEINNPGERHTIMASSDVIDYALDSTWINREDYVFLLEGFEQLQPDPRVIVLSGLVTEAEGQEFDPWFVITSSQVDSSRPAGILKVVFLDADRKPLSEFGFDLQSWHSPAGNGVTSGSFVLNAPYVPAQIIQIQKLGQIIYERLVSAHAPVLDVSSFGDPGRLDANTLLPLRWQASDADGDPLWFAVDFSADDGTTWSPVARGLRDSSADWLVPDLGTDYGRLRIRASDGVNTSEWVSPRFPIAGQEDRQLVARIGPDQVVRVGQTVALDGSMSGAASLSTPAYEWQAAGYPAKTTVELSDATQAVASFVPTTAGRYLFKLAVSTTNQPPSIAYTTVVALDLGPPLAIRAETSGRVRLSWPATIQGYHLESAASLGTPPPWDPSRDQPSVETGEWVQVVSPGEAMRFYRLTSASDPFAPPPAAIYRWTARVAGTWGDSASWEGPVAGAGTPSANGSPLADVLFDHGAGALASVVDGTYALRSLTFQADAPEVQLQAAAGPAGLSLGAGGLVKWSAGTNLIALPLTLSTGQFWQNEAGSLTVQSLDLQTSAVAVGGGGRFAIQALAGGESSQVSVLGPGSVELGDPVPGTLFRGALAVSGGTLSASRAVLNSASAVVLRGGTLSLPRATNLNSTASLGFLGGEVVVNGAAGGLGTVQLENPTALRLDAGTGSLSFAGITLGSSAGQLLVYGWRGTGGVSGLGRRLLVQTAPGEDVLASVTFVGPDFEAGAIRLPTGELVPIPKTLSMIPSDAFVQFQAYGAGLNKTVVAVTGQSFPEAMQIGVAQKPAQVYNAGVSLRTTQPVSANDNLVARFWIRRVAAASGTARVQFNFEQASGTFDKSIQFPVAAADDQWHRQAVKFKSRAAYAAGLAQVSFWAGYDLQTVQIAGLEVINYFGATPP